MSAALLKKMREMGLTMEQAIELMEVWEDGLRLPLPPSDALLKKRERDAARMRDKREKEAEEKRVAGDVAATSLATSGDKDARLTCEPAQVVTPSSSLRSEEEDPPVSPNGLTAPKGADKTRGTRLPDGWTPDEGGWTYAENTLGLNVDPANELDRFRDYWRAVPGAKGRKADWAATWRNWVRTAAERTPNLRKAHERPHADPKFLARHANYAAAAEGFSRLAEENRQRRGDGREPDPFGEGWGA